MRAELTPLIDHISPADTIRGSLRSHRSANGGFEACP